MPTRRAAALTLLILVLGMGLAACGGGHAGKAATTAATARADERWRAGLTRWHERMLDALDGMSILFSRAKPVQLLEAGDRKTGARLTSYSTTLAGCSTSLETLGPAPVELAAAQRAARQACSSLERGARLVVQAVEALQGGRGFALFDRASVPLGDGQNTMEVAVDEARQVAAPSS